jgi:shikimate dehydrogenase
MTESSKKFGILAYPAGHSLSPAMFKAAFGSAGIDAAYEVFEIPEAELEEFVRDREFDGLSVSLPYKEKIVGLLDEVDKAADAIGAVNTVVRDGDVLRGFNTDWIGAVEALKELGADLDGKKVVVLGAGGAARAITYGLAREGAEIVVLSRNLEDAKVLGEDFSVEYGMLSDAPEHECDILIQATSVWITSGLDVKIVPDSYVSELGARGGVVMDIVYKPLMTPLLEYAREVGCHVVTGDKMLLNQAVKQFELWFGKEAPRHVMGIGLEKGFSA